MVERYEEPNPKAKDLIALRDREYSRQANMRTLWQSVANMVFPQTYGITTTYTPGTELMNDLYDTTAVEEAQNMTSGLVNNLFPAGQKFFDVRVPRQFMDRPDVSRYLAYLVEQVHEYIFNSNFITQVSNTIHYWVTFGHGALYSDWTKKDGLNFRDYAIGTYQCLENARGVIDTIILTCPMTARQIRQEWPGRYGPSVAQALEAKDRSNEEFSVIWVIRPRDEYDPNPILRPATRAPWESVFVQEKDAVILDEGGYDEFPFAVPRYQVVYREIHGRGLGVTLLPQVRTLNRLAKDYQEMSNKWVNPPLEVLDTGFDGNVDVTPGAQNVVSQLNSIAAIDLKAHGVYPVTKDVLEYRRDQIRQGFFKNAFESITPLTGDRRTTTEIIERLKEGMRRLSGPMGRLFVELLTPNVTRTILLLIRNGQIAPPPAALGGTNFKVEFINPLALALRDQQSRGLQYWIMALGNMETIWPGAKDNCDYDRAARDLGQSLGVKTDHIRSIRDRDLLRQQRNQQQQQMADMQMAQAAAEGYNKVTKAPEPGSLAEVGA